MKALIFPGQGSQFVGMGKDLYENIADIKELMNFANEILGFDITKIMFEGSEDELKQTKITQPAIFIHSICAAKTFPHRGEATATAGHSLGELSALTAAGVFSFEEGLKLVASRAKFMQEACENNPSSMAAILGLEDRIVEATCQDISQPNSIVVPANYNCPGQLVISGNTEAVEKACEALKEKGAKRALVLPVSGAFHSPIMQEAQDKLEKLINNITFNKPSLRVYQDVSSTASEDPGIIKQNLIKQITSPVRWTEIITNIKNDGINAVVECGPGKTLQGLVSKINKDIQISSIS